jgi:hypothetical protein
MRAAIVNPAGLDELAKDPALGEQLRPAANAILARAQGKAPSWVQAAWYVRAGSGPRGAFAQAVGRGSGIVLAEYGGARSPAYAMFRSSL